MSKPSFVKETGFLSAALGVIVIPSALITVVSPASFLKDALVKSFNSGFKEYVNSLPACLSFKLFPAFNVTVSPAFTASFVVPSALPVPSSPLVAFQAALLIASATLPMVATLPLSVSGTDTVPALSPSVTLVIEPVLTCKPLSPTVIVVPSAFTFKPSSVVSKDLSAGLTFTPSAVTSIDLSAGFTLMLPSVSFSNPSLVLTVDLPSSSFNCFTLTASVSFSPALTLVIVLLPLSKPSLERTTSPAVTLPSLPSIATGLSPPTVTTPFGPKDTLPAPSPSPVIDLIPFNSGCKEYVKSLPACLSFKLLPAFKVTLSPALTFSSVVPSTSPESSLSLVAFQAALLIASATLPMVATLPLSASGTDTVPALSPSVTLVILPVLTCKPLSPTVIVVPSALTFTPFAVTLMDLSAGCTTILPSLLVKPLPIFGDALLIISATF